MASSNFDVGATVGWFQGIINTIVNWISKLVVAVVPRTADSEAKHQQFLKFGFIIVAIYFATKILRLNIGIGGKKR